MLDIDKFWLLILTGNFLGLVYILNIILFRPMLKIYLERESLTQGSLDAAKEMNSRKEEGLNHMNKEISDARSKAKEAFEGLRNAGAGNWRKISLLRLNRQQLECFRRPGKNYGAREKRRGSPLSPT